MDKQLHRYLLPQSDLDIISAALSFIFWNAGVERNLEGLLIGYGIPNAIIFLGVILEESANSTVH